MVDPSSEIKSNLRKLRDCLQGVDFMRHLKLDEMDKLLEAMKKRSFAAGDVIIKQGDKGDAFFIIAAGRCTVWIKKGFANPTLADTLYPDQFFGEGALATDAPRSATVKAEVLTECFILHKDDFNQILMKNPSIATAIKARIAGYKAKY